MPAVHNPKMSSPHKPEGYTTVAPYLIVDGAQKTIEFLARVFGAKELRRFPGPDGKLMHAEVRIDGTVVMLADGATGWPPIPSHVHIYVPDVDATYKRALKLARHPCRRLLKRMTRINAAV
jgi:PhnB protein